MVPMTTLANVVMAAISTENKVAPSQSGSVRNA